MFTFLVRNLIAAGRLAMRLLRGAGLLALSALLLVAMVAVASPQAPSRVFRTGKNIWRLCKTYGRIIGHPMLKLHDLRHGVAMEILEHHHDLEAVRAMLGHTRIDTTQTYARIRPAELKRAMEFYEEKAVGLLDT